MTILERINKQDELVSLLLENYWVDDWRLSIPTLEQSSEASDEDVKRIIELFKELKGEEND